MRAPNGFTLSIPDMESIEQGQEFFFVETNGEKKKIKFHDYDRIYEIPGLYEHLFYERYKCNSPEIVCGLLKEHIGSQNKDGFTLKALDIGAGNGMVGEQLADIGVDALVGIDIIEEAAEAARRDRPGLYDKYYVADLTCLTRDIEKRLDQYKFNCMTVVAALGFDDIPPAAFAHGYNFVADSGWVAFNIKEDFVCDEDQSGFCSFIHRLEAQGILDIRVRQRYRHRFCQDGTPLYYIAVVGRKQSDIPLELLDTIAPVN